MSLLNEVQQILLILSDVRPLLLHAVTSPPGFPRSLLETELTSLCQSVLEDFNLVLFYLPPQTHTGALHSPSEEDEEQQQQQQQHADTSCPVLPDTLVFKMVVTCLMVVHSLKRGGPYPPAAVEANKRIYFFFHLISYARLCLQDPNSTVPP